MILFSKIKLFFKKIFEAVEVYLENYIYYGKVGS